MIMIGREKKIRKGVISRINPDRRPLLPIIRRVFSWIALTVLLAVGCWGGWATWLILDQPVAFISVTGDFKYASRVDVSELVTDSLEGGFISTDLDFIRTQLEANTWIESAKVSRQWPDGLVVVVQEEVPIARWNQGGFLNRSGEVLQVKDSRGLDTLPQLTGPMGEEQRVMEQYRHAAQILSPAGLKTIEFHLDERNAWHLEVSHGLKVAVGQGDVTERLQRFIEVYKAVLQNRESEVKSIDARYPNGVAVRWHEAAVNVGGKS
jgi:cell division protein FtsQ